MPAAWTAFRVRLVARRADSGFCAISRAFARVAAEQRVVGEASRRDAGLDGARRVDPLGGVEELGGAPRADHGLEQVAAGALGHEAEGHEGQPEPQALAHVDDVAVEQEGRADPTPTPRAAASSGLSKATSASIRP